MKIIKKLLCLVMACSVLFLAGCPKNSPKMPSVFNKIIDRSNTFLEDFENHLKRYDCLMAGRTWDGANCTGAFSVPTADHKKQAQIVRDDALFELIRIIDYNYLQFEQDLYGRRATTSFLADFIETGANLAGNITNGVRAKNIIFASINAFRTGRKSYNLNYFQEQTTSLLVLKMQTSRNRVLKEIIIQSKRDVDGYSLDKGLGDIIKYFFAGTLPRAFEELQADTSLQARQAEQEILDFKEITVVKPATQAERDTAVKANNIINDLAQILSTGTVSEKTQALGKLQKMVEEIQNDPTLLAAITGNGTLNPTWTTILANVSNGSPLAQNMSQLKGDAFGLIADDLVSKINQIIIKHGK